MLAIERTCATNGIMIQNPQIDSMRIIMNLVVNDVSGESRHNKYENISKLGDGHETWDL